MSNSSLFDLVVHATGLNPRIAPFVVRRVCASLGFTAANMNQDHLLKSLDALGAAIRVYRSPAEADEAIARLRWLATGGIQHGASPSP